MFIAQVNDAELLWKLLGIAGVILGLLTSGVMLWRNVTGASTRQRVEPQPLVVAAAERHPTKEEFERALAENARAHDQLHAKLGGVERGARADVESKVADLHGKINKVDREVGELKQATDMQNQQLSRMDSKIDRLLSRTPTNT